MISALPSAPLGSVTHWQDYQPSTFRNAASAILCRNTAPLVSFAFQLLARGVPCHIVGKEIEIGLLKIVDRGVASSLKEAEALKRRGKRQQAANLLDKIDAVTIIGRGLDKEQTKAKITKLFESGSSITLSTVHKSKGLEWPIVFLLDWHLLPSPYAEAEWEKVQERNLQYVAVTRAKLDLVFIRSGCWAKLPN